MAIHQTSGNNESLPMAEINITPLIDVMLVLLIIFMVSMPTMLSQISMEVPKKSTAAATASVKPSLYVLIDATGNYALQIGTKKPVALTAEQLRDKLLSLYKTYGSELVYVKANTHLNYGHVVQLIEAMSKAGYTKVALDKI